ncbi:MAG: phage Gp37/Gp68 family protein [Phycisphaerales bacterium]|nr:phage Gp37/Gp68 family protein [Phycisphaerales bacterium]
MAIGSTIEWTEATWNPVAGCTPISPGCLNCYAARMALRLESVGGSTAEKYAGTAKRARDGRPVFAGRINLDHDALDLPRRWRKGRRIFVNSMSDLFHENVPTEFIQAVFEVMGECPQHEFQVLTKRPERAAALSDDLVWTDNIWMGTSVESAMYVHRIDSLRKTAAKVHFLSCEPLLGPIPKLPLDHIEWVIVGGESGPGARPMEAKWVEQIRDRCAASGVAFFFKQWGGVQKSKTGRQLCGRLWSEMPGETDGDQAVGSGGVGARLLAR